MNVYAASGERHPRIDFEQLQAAAADLVMLPDEPYVFSAVDGPAMSPRHRAVIVPARRLTCYGLWLATARDDLLELVRGSHAAAT